MIPNYKFHVLGICYDMFNMYRKDFYADDLTWFLFPTRKSTHSSTFGRLIRKSGKVFKFHVERRSLITQRNALAQGLQRI